MQTLFIIPLLLASIGQENPGPREWSMVDLVDQIGPRIGRTFIYGTRAKLDRKRVALPALPGNMSKEKLTRILERAFQVSNLVMVPPLIPGDPWSVNYAGSSSKLPLPVIGSSEEIPAGYGMYMKIFRPKNISPRTLHAALINKTSFPQGTLAVQDSGVLIITDYASKLRMIEKLVELADKHAGSVSPGTDNPANIGPGPRLLLSNESREVWIMETGEMAKALKNVAEEARQTLTLSPMEKGLRVLVLNVKPGSGSFTQALYPNDVILSFNGHEISTEEDLKKVADDPRNDTSKSMTIVIERDGNRMALVFRTVD